MAGPRPDPLGHLLLHQQHQGLIRGIHRSIQATDQPIQQRAGDVVRNVGHHLSGRCTVLQQQRQLEHIALAQADARLIPEALLQAADQIAIQLNGMHRSSGRGQQPLGQSSPPRSHLQHAVLRLQIRSRHDSIQHRLILQPMLAEAFTGLMSLKPHGSTVHQHSRSKRYQCTAPSAGGRGTIATAT